MLAACSDGGSAPVNRDETLATLDSMWGECLDALGIDQGEAAVHDEPGPPPYDSSTWSPDGMKVDFPDDLSFYVVPGEFSTPWDADTAQKTAEADCDNLVLFAPGGE
jgi:hypothetical protein